MAVAMVCPVCKSSLKIIEDCPEKDPKQCQRGHPFPKKDVLYRIRLSKYGISADDYYTGTRKGAFNAHATIKSQLNDRRYVKPTRPITLDEVFEIYQEVKTKVRDMPNYANMYENHLKRPFGNRALENIKKLDVERFMGALSLKKSNRAGTLAEGTQGLIVRLLARLINFAIKRELYVGSNPCTGLELPSTSGSRYAPFSEDEEARILEAIRAFKDRTTSNLFMLLYATGARSGEARKLLWKDVDLDAGRVTFRNTKTSAEVVIPINQTAVQVLKDQRALDRPGEYVFGANGVPHSPIFAPWRSIAKRAKLKKGTGAHSLRHHFATRLVSAGAPLYGVSKLLGHTTSRCTERYAKFAPDDLQRVTQIFDLGRPQKKGKVIPIRRPA